MPPEATAQRLREAGLRVTAARVAVLDVLDEARDHPRVEQVVERVRGRGTRLSVQAGYDVCEALRRAGLARRIEPAGDAARFEARVGDNHHHLVCRACGWATDVDCPVGEAPCLAPSQLNGFEVDEAEVVFWGTCARCRAANGVAPDRAASQETARSITREEIGA